MRSTRRTRGWARCNGWRAASLLGCLCMSGALVALADQPGGSAVGHDERRAERWTGTYRHVGGEADEQARLHAIDRATDDMMFIGRAIARGRLRDNTEPYETIRIRVTDTEITVVTDVRWTTPIDGSPRRLEDAQGDTYRVGTRFERDHLVQTIRNDALHNVNTFRLSSDGQRMRMHVRIAHDRIPRTIDYALQYRRQ